MYCKNCGSELRDGSKFCSKCGAKVEFDGGEESRVNAGENPGDERADEVRPLQEQGYNEGGDQGGSEKKFDWKVLLQPENIERFAPLAALMPLAMGIVIPLLSFIFSLTLENFPVGETISLIIISVLKLVFVLASGLATAGLIYVAVTKKDMTSVFTWVAPFGALMAFIACIGIALGWGVVNWIFGIISVLLGLEFLARIVIEKQPMESPLNPGAAFATYKQYYKSYREKYPTTKDLERRGVEDREMSKFDGDGVELFGYIILASLVSTITCGIAAPWMICKIKRWQLSHTVINNKRLVFTGTGGSLFGHWLLWELLTVVTCGIYGLFVHIALRKWEMKNTFIEGEEAAIGESVSYFDGGYWDFIGYEILCGLLLMVTCGLAFPWVMEILQKWDTRHQVINGRRLVFSGTGLGFLGEYLIIAILSFITCGIYGPWGTVRMNKYIIRNTDFVDQTVV